MVLVRCDQCGAVHEVGAHAWLNLGRSLSDQQAAQLDDDDDQLEPTLHFCGWQCAGIYTTARALVEQ
jgi:hypothetical protein